MGRIRAPNSRGSAGGLGQGAGHSINTPNFLSLPISLSLPSDSLPPLSRRSKNIDRNVLQNPEIGDSPSLTAIPPPLIAVGSHRKKPKIPQKVQICSPWPRCYRSRLLFFRICLKGRRSKLKVAASEGQKRFLPSPFEFRSSSMSCHCL